MEVVGVSVCWLHTLCQLQPGPLLCVEVSTKLTVFGVCPVKLLFFLALFPDGVDGKQARRTNSSTPLGELFDHGLDSWACVYFVVTVYSTFGRGSTGVSVFVLYLLLWVVLFSFILSHWEKYNTGILFLPWGYDISQVVSMHPSLCLPSAEAQQAADVPGSVKGPKLCNAMLLWGLPLAGGTQQHEESCACRREQAVCITLSCNCIH